MAARLSNPVVPATVPIPLTFTATAATALAYTCFMVVSATTMRIKFAIIARQRRNHVRQLEALGYKACLEPAA